MTENLEFYRITLDFIYKITGPIIAISIIGLCFRYRKQLSIFIAENIDRIKGRIFNQEFDIELRKKAQDTPTVDSEKEQLKKDKEQLIQELEFEKIYSIIFGSQLTLLALLKDSVLPLSKVMDFFSSVRERYPRIFSDWKLEQYLNILLKNKLIESSSDITSFEIEYFVNRYIDLKITEKGLNFLKYIGQNNYNYRDF